MVKVVGPTERKGDKRFLETLKFNSLIDALHRAVIAWQSGDETTLQAMLSLRATMKPSGKSPKPLPRFCPKETKSADSFLGFSRSVGESLKQHKRKHNFRSNNEKHQGGAL
jgi:hypothetical protein